MPVDIGKTELAIHLLLEGIGENPERAGLLRTPERVAKAWRETWASGYGEPPEDLLKLFPHEAPHSYANMVLVRDIAFYSHCEHHLAPFFGTATIAYIPHSGGVVGLSKLARVVEHHARRLQTQENLTTQIGAYLEARLSLHVAVMMSAHHTCMSGRGVMQPNAKTVTSFLAGDFMHDGPTRAEYTKIVIGG